MANSLLSPSTLPFELPDFAHLSDAHFREAIERGMAEQLAELDAVATNTEPATVGNVLEAWERSGRTLARALNAFWVAKAADTNDERDSIEADMAPRLAAHTDAILLDTRLYDRLIELDGRRKADEVELDEQDAFCLSERLREYERGGIHLDDEDQTRLRELNERLATLSTTFEKLLVAGRNAAAVHVTDEAHLDGLAEDDKAGAAQAAQAAGLDGWVLELTKTTQHPPVSVLHHRPTRQRVYEAGISRGLGGEHDTRGVLLDIVRVSGERARLLGFPHHAAYAAEDGCAGSTEAVNDILGRLGPATYDLMRTRAEAWQRRLERIEPGATLEPWDVGYLSELISAEETSLDGAALRPYLEFDRVLVDGVFAAAEGLYGLTFHRREDLVGYTAESRVYEVREADGSVLGAAVLDPYTRSNKLGGAWMTAIVDQNELLEQSPVVSNTCNFNPPVGASPSLLTWDNVITLFHEFGHDLHGLLSNVRYPSRSGTAVPRDFVEFPSQVNEIWAYELLPRYARHHETGEPMPDAWVEKLRGGKKDAFKYAELQSAMILDQAWYQAPEDQLPQDVDGVEAFEAEALARGGVDLALVPPRYRSTYFAHAFGGGYSARYYSYLWSEIFDADTVAWFRENGGLTRENGQRFRDRLLGRGGSIPSTEAYRDFRGTDPDPAHLLRRIGV
jgi:peptidyl-dipeptidase Dcp